jgi:hypothetical protein
MPSEVRQRIEEAAQESGRSVNAEIVTRLRQSFAPSGGLRRADIAVVVKATIEELAQRGLLAKPARKR